jgi:hypothetical protein
MNENYLKAMGLDGSFYHSEISALIVSNSFVTTFLILDIFGLTMNYYQFINIHGIRLDSEIASLSTVIKDKSDENSSNITFSRKPNSPLYTLLNDRKQHLKFSLLYTVVLLNIQTIYRKYYMKMNIPQSNSTCRIGNLSDIVPRITTIKTDILLIELSQVDCDILFTCPFLDLLTFAVLFNMV